MKQIKLVALSLLLLCALVVNTFAQDAKTNIKAAYDALSRRDFATFVNLCAPEFTEYATGPMPVKGPQAAVEAYQMYLSAFPDLKFQVKEITGGENGRYYLKVNITGTNTGAFGMLPPTGKSINLTDVDILELNAAGKATSHWSANPTGMLTAIGYSALANPATATVFAAYDAFGKGDVPAIQALCQDDAWFDIHDRSFNGGKARLYKGKAEIGNFFAELGSQLRYTKFQPWRFLADGDDVVVLVSAEFTQVSTGKNYSVNYSHHFRIVDGKIVSFKGMDDVPVAK